MKLLSFIFLFSSLISFTRAQQQNSTTTTINQIFDKNHDYYSFKTSVHEDALNGFTIEYKNYYKIVTNKMTSKTYCLVGFNQDRPEECSIETTIQIPIKTFSIDSDSYQVVPFIELLGLQNNVTKTATVNMTSPCIQDTHIISPDITFSSIHSGAMFVSFSANQNNLTPLQKASWILYLGAFFDLELKAFSIYSQISNNYECHKHNLINMKTSSRKGVSWTTYSPSNKLYTVHSDLYYFQLTQDAGGHLEATNVAQGDTFQTDITIDQLALVNALHGAEYIIDTSSIEIDYSTWLNGNALYFTKNDSIQSRIRQVPAIVNHKVYSMNGLVSKNHISDWTQRAAARPDLVLLELIKLLNPDFNIASNHLFPIWLTAFNTLNETRRTMTVDIYGGCQDIASNAFAQSQCTLSSNSTFIQDHLSKGEKAGISLGTILCFIFILLAAFWFFRRYRRNRHRHQFYKMNEL